MYEDKNGNFITIHTVVKNSQGKVYTVVGRDASMENFLKLRNGCIACQDKPENLEVVTEI